MGAAGLHRAVCHSQLPSLSRRWMLHPHTLPAAADQCYTTLSPPIGRMDGAMCSGRTGVCVGGGLRDEQTRVRVRLLPVPLVSPTMPPRPRAAATHGSLSTDGRRVGGPARGGARRRSTAHEDDAAAVLRTVPRCN